MTARRSALLKNLMLALGSTVLTMLALEISLRSLYQDDFREWNVGPAYSHETWITEHFSPSDALFRTKHLAAGGDTFSVLGVGDSFTFGVELQAGETYLARIIHACCASAETGAVSALLGGTPGVGRETDRLIGADTRAEAAAGMRNPGQTPLWAQPNPSTPFD